VLSFSFMATHSCLVVFTYRLADSYLALGNKIVFLAVLRIRDILVQMRIRILRSVPLTNGYGCGTRRAKNIRMRIRNFVHLHHSSKIKSMVSSNFWSSGGSFSGAGKTRAKAWYYC